MIHTRKIGFSDYGDKMQVLEPFHIDYQNPPDADGDFEMADEAWRDINYYCTTFKCELKQIIALDKDPGRKMPMMVGIFEGADPYDIWGYHSEAAKNRRK